MSAESYPESKAGLRIDLGPPAPGAQAARGHSSRDTCMEQGPAAALLDHSQHLRPSSEAVPLCRVKIENRSDLASSDATSAIVNDANSSSLRQETGSAANRSDIPATVQSNQQVGSESSDGEAQTKAAVQKLQNTVQFNSDSDFDEMLSGDDSELEGFDDFLEGLTKDLNEGKYSDLRDKSAGEDVAPAQSAVSVSHVPVKLEPTAPDCSDDAACNLPRNMEHSGQEEQSQENDLATSMPGENPPDQPPASLQLRGNEVANESSQKCVTAMPLASSEETPQAEKEASDQPYQSSNHEGSLELNLVDKPEGNEAVGKSKSFIALDKCKVVAEEEKNGVSNAKHSSSVCSLSTCMEASSSMPDSTAPSVSKQAAQMQVTGMDAQNASETDVPTVDNGVAKSHQYSKEEESHFIARLVDKTVQADMSGTGYEPQESNKTKTADVGCCTSDDKPIAADKNTQTDMLTTPAAKNKMDELLTNARKDKENEKHVDMYCEKTFWLLENFSDRIAKSRSGLEKAKQARENLNKRHGLPLSEQLSMCTNAVRAMLNALERGSENSSEKAKKHPEKDVEKDRTGQKRPTEVVQPFKAEQEPVDPLLSGSKDKEQIQHRVESHHGSQQSQRDDGTTEMMARLGQDQVRHSLWTENRKFKKHKEILEDAFGPEFLRSLPGDMIDTFVGSALIRLNANHRLALINLERLPGHVQKVLADTKRWRRMNSRDVPGVDIKRLQSELMTGFGEYLSALSDLQPEPLPINPFKTKYVYYGRAIRLRGGSRKHPFLPAMDSIPKGVPPSKAENVRCSGPDEAYSSAGAGTHMSSSRVLETNLSVAQNTSFKIPEPRPLEAPKAKCRSAAGTDEGISEPSTTLGGQAPSAKSGSSSLWTEMCNEFISKTSAGSELGKAATRQRRLSGKEKNAPLPAPCAIASEVGQTESSQSTASEQVTAPPLPGAYAEIPEAAVTQETGWSAYVQPSPMSTSLPENNDSAYSAPISRCLIPISPVDDLSEQSGTGGPIPSAAISDCLIPISLTEVTGLQVTRDVSKPASASAVSSVDLTGAESRQVPAADSSKAVGESRSRCSSDMSLSEIVSSPEAGELPESDHDEPPEVSGGDNSSAGPSSDGNKGARQKAQKIIRKGLDLLKWPEDSKRPRKRQWDSEDSSGTPKRRRLSSEESSESLVGLFCEEHGVVHDEPWETFLHLQTRLDGSSEVFCPLCKVKCKKKEIVSHCELEHGIKKPTVEDFFKPRNRSASGERSHRSKAEKRRNSPSERLRHRCRCHNSRHCPREDERSSRRKSREHRTSGRSRHRSASVESRLCSPDVGRARHRSASVESTIERARRLSPTAERTHRSRHRRDRSPCWDRRRRNGSGERRRRDRSSSPERWHRNRSGDRAGSGERRGRERSGDRSGSGDYRRRSGHYWRRSPEVRPNATPPSRPASSNWKGVSPEIDTKYYFKARNKPSNKLEANKQEAKPSRRDSLHRPAEGRSHDKGSSDGASLSADETSKASLDSSGVTRRQVTSVILQPVRPNESTPDPRRKVTSVVVRLEQPKDSAVDSQHEVTPVVMRPESPKDERSDSQLSSEPPRRHLPGNIQSVATSRSSSSCTEEPAQKRKRISPPKDVRVVKKVAAEASEPHRSSNPDVSERQLNFEKNYKPNVLKPTRSSSSMANKGSSTVRVQKVGATQETGAQSAENPCQYGQDGSTAKKTASEIDGNTKCVQVPSTGSGASETESGILGKLPNPVHEPSIHEAEKGRQVPNTVPSKEIVTETTAKCVNVSMTGSSSSEVECEPTVEQLGTDHSSSSQSQTAKKPNQVAPNETYKQGANLVASSKRLRAPPTGFTNEELKKILSNMSSSESKAVTKKSTRDAEKSGLAAAKPEPAPTPKAKAAVQPPETCTETSEPGQVNPTSVTLKPEDPTSKPKGTKSKAAAKKAKLVAKKSKLEAKKSEQATAEPEAASPKTRAAVQKAKSGTKTSEPEHLKPSAVTQEPGDPITKPKAAAKSKAATNKAKAATKKSKREAKKSELAAAKPDAATLEIKAATQEPEIGTEKSEFGHVKPTPAAPKPKDSFAPTSKPNDAKSKAGVKKSKAAAKKSKLEAKKSEEVKLKSDAVTLNTKATIQKPEIGTKKSESGYMEPTSVTLKPGDPAAKLNESNTRKPEHVTQKPDIVVTMPKVAPLEPGLATQKPTAATPNPNIARQLPKTSKKSDSSGEHKTDSEISQEDESDYIAVIEDSSEEDDVFPASETPGHPEGQEELSLKSSAVTEPSCRDTVSVGSKRLASGRLASALETKSVIESTQNAEKAEKLTKASDGLQKTTEVPPQNPLAKSNCNEEINTRNTVNDSSKTEQNNEAEESGSSKKEMMDAVSSDQNVKKASHTKSIPGTQEKESELKKSEPLKRTTSSEQSRPEDHTTALSEQKGLNVCESEQTEHKAQIQGQDIMQKETSNATDQTQNTLPKEPSKPELEVQPTSAGPSKDKDEDKVPKTLAGPSEETKAGGSEEKKDNAPTVKPGTIRYRCDRCLQELSTMVSLQNHEKACKAGPPPCLDCNRKVFNPAKHRLSCNGRVPWLCLYCHKWSHDLRPRHSEQCSAQCARCGVVGPHLCGRGPVHPTARLVSSSPAARQAPGSPPVRPLMLGSPASRGLRSPRPFRARGTLSAVRAPRGARAARATYRPRAPSRRPVDPWEKRQDYEEDYQDYRAADGNWTEDYGPAGRPDQGGFGYRQGAAQSEGYTHEQCRNCGVWGPHNCSGQGQTGAAWDHQCERRGAWGPHDCRSRVTPRSANWRVRGRSRFR